jgi:hypothetical protein
MEFVELRSHPPQDKRRTTIQRRILQPSVGYAANEPRRTRRGPRPKQIAVDEDPPGETPAEHPILVAGGMDQQGKVRMPPGDPLDTIRLAGTAGAQRPHDQHGRRENGTTATAPQAVDGADQRPDESCSLADRSGYAIIGNHGHHR